MLNIYLGELKSPLILRVQTIEAIVNDNGYIHNVDTRGTHRRTRYRLDSSPHGELRDPNLELVHYTQTAPERQIPVNNLPPSPAQVRLMQQRRYLEEAGTLERKEFMFTDQANWPKITMPGQKGPAMGGNPYGPRTPISAMPGIGRPPAPGQPFYPPGGNIRPGANPQHSKRTRQVGMPPMSRTMLPGAPMAPVTDTEGVDEEAPAIGDFLDLLSPREISNTRYTQHHEWMEEVLASPYSINQILPEDINFNLPGELHDLTKDLFVPSGSGEPRSIKQEDVSELEKRIANFQQKQKTEIERMKEEHVGKTEEMRRPMRWLEIEKRLADIPPDVTDAQNQIQKIVEEAEQLAGAKLSSRDEVVLVQKGGLLDRQEAAAIHLDNQVKDDGDQQQDEFGEFTNLDSAGEALDFYSTSYDDSGMTFGNT